VLTWQEIYQGHERGTEPFLDATDWQPPVGFFVGRNGSGKTRAARALADRTPGSHRLSTDRLIGIMQVGGYQWGGMPQGEYRGVPLSDEMRRQAVQVGRPAGVATEELYVLGEQPDVLLRVAAFVRRALGRIIELRERAGYLDPVVLTREGEYSLLRDEGHGLRELVILLAATYRDDWSLLVVDEPELHLHPAMVRLWLSELQAECQTSSRRAIIVTHEPLLLRPTTAEEMTALWLFRPGEVPVNMGQSVIPQQHDRVKASLSENPSLVSDLAFSPRPVLVEGTHDTAALTTALIRVCSPEAVAQTDLIPCGGSSLVAMWFEIAHKLGLDVRAVADLDAIFTPDLQRSLNEIPEVRDAYAQRLAAQPPTTSTVLQPLIRQMDSEAIATNPQARAKWLADLTDADGAGHVARRDHLLEICRDAGIWLHAQGTLEAVLGISDKGGSKARDAAAQPGPIDDVATWCAFALDLTGDVEKLLNLAVERIAHGIMEAQRLEPNRQFHDSVDSGMGSSRLVSVTPIGVGRYMITVLLPKRFSGWWLEFDRNTPPKDLVLRMPDSPRDLSSPLIRRGD
jgi:AAA domain, putative AbiEii toxin, Type IV TA system